MKKQIQPVKKWKIVPVKKKVPVRKPEKPQKCGRDNLSKFMPVKLKMIPVKKVRKYARETIKVPVKKHIYCTTFTHS